MPLPSQLQVIYDAQSQEVRDKLARQLAEGTDPVPLCCSTDSTGNEVCIAVESHTQCCAGCAQKYCTHGMTNNDGSVTCYDET